jgi:cysteine desulfurase
MKSIYLDYAAATPMDKRVLSSMQPYFSDKFYNPSAVYLAAKEVAGDVQVARRSLAKWLGCQPGEICFTAGGTEANNLAIQGVLNYYPGANVVYSAIEHDSVIKPASLFDSRPVVVDQQGQIDLQDLAKKIDDKTVLVSVMYANNEIGSIQPLQDIAKLIKQVKTERAKAGVKLPLYFHTDACQAAAYLNIHIHDLGVDLLTLNGGKIYGPKQSGLLVVKAGTNLQPLILGGGQENGLRSGTENVAAIIGLAVALDLVQNRRRAETSRLETLQKLFIELLDSKLPKAVVNGGLKRRLCNNVHVTFPGHDNERLMMELDEKGVICASGSACSASSDQPSHVLEAVGLDKASINSSIRFTMGLDTTSNDVERTISELEKLDRKRYNRS